MDKTKLTWMNGSRIKQGDASSVFKLKLGTEDDKVLNGPAVLQLIDNSKAKVEKAVEVTDNAVTFQLDRPLPVGVYIIEVEHAGYVFPSSNAVTLTVTENLGDVITKDVEEALDIKAYIRKLVSDSQAGNIDLDALAQRLNIQGYDDSSIRATLGQISDEIERLKQSEGHSTSYDDSGFLRRLEALENKEGGGSGDPGPRHGPTAYTLDRRTSPWTVWFDNGCALKLPDYGDAGTIYGYGHSSNLHSTTIEPWPISGEIIKASRGLITLDHFRETADKFDYWAPNTQIVNPVQDSSRYDWSAAIGNPGTNEGSYGRKPIYARTMYELGIWSDTDVESLGAVRL